MLSMSVMSSTLPKYLSIVCIMMSVAPQAVWYGGRVNVRTGFMMANLGRQMLLPNPIFRSPSSFVITLASLISLPAAGMVSTTPTGRLSFGAYLRA